ncbi:MAG: transposase [Candidatus Levybacteria bacterium]|nr:transposase [Candidatus Levybacteria bacterium]
MAAKNSRKTYLENGYYHIYNRGVEKRIIFQDQQDYAVFLSYLKEYLLPKNEKKLYERLSDPQISSREKDKTLRALRMNNFAGEITLLAYCLMPNHFHFFVKQKSIGAIDSFMNSLALRYTTYFNRKYKRVGHLYQGVYKAVLVTSDPQFLHLSRYIHKQALRLQDQVLREKQPCSYPEYLGQRRTEWINPEEILSFFNKENSNLSYENFVKQSDDGQLPQKLILEED